jgi:hypothetical protein
MQQEGKKMARLGCFSKLPNLACKANASGKRVSTMADYGRLQQCNAIGTGSN